jgi:cytochrome c oxidase subunit 2
MKKWGMLLVVLAIIAGVARLTPYRTVAAQAAPQPIEVVAKRFSFEPSDVTLKRGVPVVLVLKSADVAHGVKFRELNLDIKVDKGGTVETPFTPEKTGNFVGHCSVFCGSGHGSMTLTLHIVD